MHRYEKLKEYIEKEEEEAGKINKYKPELSKGSLKIYEKKQDQASTTQVHDRLYQNKQTQLQN